MDKILGSTFSRSSSGLTWIETAESDDEGNEYKLWLLVDATGRMLASIDGPTRHQLCYGVQFEEGPQRKYIHLEGAQQYAFGRAQQILRDELARRASGRKGRRTVGMAAH